MKTWLRLTLITMTVGGGFTGFVGTFPSLFSSSARPLNLLMTIVFLGLYAYVVVVGLIFVHVPQRTGPLVTALAIQIPWISSPLIVYKFAAGFHAAISVGSPEGAGNIGVRVGWDLLLGSSWRFALLQDNPWDIGVNLVPFVILILLWRAVPTQRDNIGTTVSASAMPPDSLTQISQLL